MRLPSSYSLYVFIFISALLLLGAGFFLQYIKNFLPCLLCISQRFIIALIALLALSVIIVKPSNKMLRWYGVLLFLISCIGMFLAMRQLYLESLPPSAHAMCLPGLDYLIRVLPWKEILISIFLGGAECGAHVYYILGVTIPLWLSVFFGFLIIFACIEVIRNKKNIPAEHD